MLLVHIVAWLNQDEYSYQIEMLLSENLASYMLDYYIYAFESVFHGRAQTARTYALTN